MNRNSPVPLWAVLSIGVAAIVSVYLLGQSQLLKPEEDLAVNRLSVAPRTPTRFLSATSSPTVAASEAAMPTRTLAPDLRERGTYENNKYGFAFVYPSKWGEVEFAESSAEDVNYKPAQRLRHPDSGKMFVGNFSQNSRCGFGGITRDYTYPSEWPPFASPGWTEKEGAYYSLWSGGSVTGISAHARLRPSRIISSTKGPIALLTETQSAGFDLLTLDFNLAGPVFHGITIGCQGLFPEHAEVLPEDRDGLLLVASTFYNT